MKFAAHVLCIVAFTLPAAFAETPSEVTARYFKVLQKKDYEAAAAFFDPAALKQFRKMMSFTKEIPAEAAKPFLSMFFGPDATAESVAKMSDAKYFALFLRGALAQAEAMGGVDFSSMEVLGEVPEGDNVVHVLTRNKVTMAELEVESMEVVSFKKSGESWKALLSGQMTGMAAQLKQAFDRE